MSEDTPAAAPPEAAQPVVPSPTTAGRSGPAAFPSRRRPTFVFFSRKPRAANPLATPLGPPPPAGPRSRHWAGAPSTNEKALYGDLLPDVMLLRRRGFGVHREGELFRVGNRLMDAAALQDVAARERRLLTPK
jgi:hypothetical protein